VLRKTKETFSFCQFLSRPYRKFPGKLGVLGKRSTRQHIIRRKSIFSPAHPGLSGPVTGAAWPSRRSERSPALPSATVRPTRVGCKCFAGLIIGPHHPAPSRRVPASVDHSGAPARRAAPRVRRATGKADRRHRMNPCTQPIRHPQERSPLWGDQQLCGYRTSQRYDP
jgi:hypothetical protein